MLYVFVVYSYAGHYRKLPKGNSESGCLQSVGGDVTQSVSVECTDHAKRRFSIVAKLGLRVNRFLGSSSVRATGSASANSHQSNDSQDCAALQVASIRQFASSQERTVTFRGFWETTSYATLEDVISHETGPFKIIRQASVGIRSPYHPVWWEAPSPAPESAWKN